MRKKYLVLLIFLGAIITVLLVVKRNYSLSPEYNYITAKLDIQKSNCRVVHIGEHIISANEQAVEALALTYGFKNVYLAQVTANELKGINNYNETIEMYLAFHNGPGWKEHYKKQVDSILISTVPQTK